MATAPDEAPARARPTLLRRLTVGALAIIAAVQIFSTQAGTITVLAQQPAYGLNLPSAHARPSAMQAWDLAARGAGRVEVIGLAASANRATPLVEPAFAAGALALGPDGAGSRWLDQAWQLSRRDPWLLQAVFARAHARHDGAGEIAAMAALLQLQLPPGQMRETLLADMAQPWAFAPALAAMRENPRWRPAFFSGLRVDQAALPAATALIAGLRDGGAPISTKAMAVLLAPLIYGPGADPAVADTLWRTWLGHNDPWGWPTPGGTAVHLPFDWTLGAHANSLDAKPGPVLGIDGNDTPGIPVASKPFHLAPGVYQFTAKPGPGLAESAISAIVVCDQESTVLADGALWQTEHPCRTGELRLLVNSASGTIVSAGLRPLPGL